MRQLLANSAPHLLNPTCAQVIATKGVKDVVTAYNGDRQRTSFGVFFNAAGDWLPPVIMLKGANTRRSLVAKEEHFRCWPEAPFILLPNATQTEDSWAQTIKYFVGHRLVPPKSLLLVDGHSSRVSVDAILSMVEEGHDLFTIPAHSSHKLQAFDVGVAAPLRKAISTASDIMRLGDQKTPGQETTNKNLITAVKIGMTKVFLPKLDAKGNNVGVAAATFRKIGVYPFNPNVITEEDSAPAHYFNELAASIKAPKVVVPTSAEKKAAVRRVTDGLLAEKASTIAKLTAVTQRKRTSAVPGATLLTGAEHIQRLLDFDEEQQAKTTLTTARQLARAAKAKSVLASAPKRKRATADSDESDAEADDVDSDGEDEEWGAEHAPSPPPPAPTTAKAHNGAGTPRPRKHPKKR